MTNEQMTALAEKIKNQTATPEEFDSFVKGYADLTEELKNLLTN